MNPAAVAPAPRLLPYLQRQKGGKRCISQVAQPHANDLQALRGCHLLHLQHHRRLLPDLRSASALLLDCVAASLPQAPTAPSCCLAALSASSSAPRPGDRAAAAPLQTLPSALCQRPCAGGRQDQYEQITE